MPLEKWQERLEGHFESVARVRASLGLPIFALEHGLNDQELEELSKLLRSRLAAGLPLRAHWLAWVVYATEEGYAYTGEEYWRSFEDHTPQWEFQDRNRISNWFREFQRKYNGVVPSGAWAEQFRIIAWPITHAVLPRYLQRYFARALYDLRFRLASLTSIEPAMIGRMIAANVYHSSARFEEFLQQEQLVGRIVLALLHKNLLEGEEPLLPSTLERIVRDLEQVRHAREWLKETSRVVSDRFKGIGRGGGPGGYQPGITPGGRCQEREPLPDIRPDMMLRYTGGDLWTLVVDVPSFKSLAALSGEVREFLKRTRCSVNGGEGKRPAGWVMSGNRRAVLKSWPDPEKPLVSFEQNQPAVDHLLESECRMTSGPVWLFRVGRDGTAREIAGRIVRPGYDYIIATRDGIAELRDGMSACSIDCHGVEAIRISVPDNVPTEYVHWLNDLGLELARTIRVWPAGLPARNWDGEGRSEWLTTEQPCFGIVHDHPVDSYILSLDQGTSTVVPAGGVGHPTFIQLPRLDAGMHFLTVRAHKSVALEGVANTPAHEGYVELRIREPEPWIPGTAAHAGLIVSGNPHDASLDTLWENEYDLSVIGPENHSVTAAVILEDGKGDEKFIGQVCAPVELPITPEIWRKRFAEFLKREQCEWRHLEASAGVLRINGQELGEFSIRFEHEALPLRWVRRRDQDKLMVRLIDDTGQEDSDLKCLCFGMEEPVRAVRPEIAKLLVGVEVQPPGGLFVAQSGDHHDMIIVSLGLTDVGFEGLGVTSDYRSVRDDPPTLVEIFRVLGYWQSARLTGFVADARRQQVLDGLLNAIYGALCGPNWVRAEKNFVANPTAPWAVKNLQAGIGQRGGFGAVLHRDATTIANNIGAITAWYSDLAKRYSVCRDPELCTFAIGLASNPHRLPKLFPNSLEELLGRLKKCPALLRGARFAALLCANHESDGGAITPRWQE